MWRPGAKIKGCGSALIKHLLADLINSSKHFTFSGVIATEISNLAGKFSKTGGAFTGDVNINSRLLQFYIGGKIGFAIKNDEQGHLCFYNHDLLLLAYLDANGNLYTRGKVIPESMS